MTNTPYNYAFRFSTLARPLRLLGVGPGSCEVRVAADVLDIRFGRWRVKTPLSNVAAAEVTGPYQSWKVLGPRLSLADRGLTFGTNTTAGVCISFHEPVPGLEPTGLLRHPNLTVTVADPHHLADQLSGPTPPDTPDQTPSSAAQLRRQP